jgi:hypothetical protein
LPLPAEEAKEEDPIIVVRERATSASSRRLSPELLGMPAPLSRVDVAPMSNVQDQDRSRPIVDLVNDPIIADAQPPAIPASQFQTSYWSRIIGQGPNAVSDPLVGRRGQPGQFPLCPPQN